MEKKSLIEFSLPVTKEDIEEWDRHFIESIAQSYSYSEDILIAIYNLGLIGGARGGNAAITQHFSQTEAL